ncbi:MAG: hypothetical protein LBU28_07500 [Spirochaetaceae bacterium]|jgi:peptide/nickel transport system permease protein|nr:hypothetical protein [Spirochaetaceae bacterium]
MFHYIFRRILQLIPVILGLTFIVFALVHIAPGDPARMLLPQDATDEDVAQMRSAMGLDRPFLVQYVHFLFGYDAPGNPSTTRAFSGLIWAGPTCQTAGV